MLQRTLTQASTLSSPRRFEVLSQRPVLIAELTQQCLLRLVFLFNLLRANSAFFFLVLVL